MGINEYHTTLYFIIFNNHIIIFITFISIIYTFYLAIRSHAQKDIIIIDVKITNELICKKPILNDSSRNRCSA